jgi:hypothetical protein
MPVHGPAGAVPILGMDEGVVLGASVAIVDALTDGDGSAPLIGDGEAAATLHPARRLAAARPTARPLRRPSAVPGGGMRWDSWPTPVQWLSILGFSAEVPRCGRTDRAFGDWPRGRPQRSQPDTIRVKVRSLIADSAAQAY